MTDAGGEARGHRRGLTADGRINNALRLGRTDTVLIVGGVLTGVLALFVDWLAGVAESVLRPKGL